MKIQTFYRHNESKAEDIDYDHSVTAKNQYQPLSEIISRVSRGEMLDIHDYTLDNPMDCKDTFDVLDAYNEINPKYEAKLKKEADDKAKAEKEAERQRIIKEYEAEKVKTAE